MAEWLGKRMGQTKKKEKSKDYVSIYRIYPLRIKKKKTLNQLPFERENSN